MRMLSRLLLLSLLANVILGAAYFALGRPRQEVERKTDAGKEVEKLPQDPADRTIAKAVRWQEIASSDYATYAENLRRLGCSDERIADLLVPELQRELFLQAAALFVKQRFASLQGKPASGWDSIEAGEHGRHREIDKAREELLREIFGVGFDSGDQPWNRWPKDVDARPRGNAFLDEPVREAIDLAKAESDKALGEYHKSAPEISGEQAREEERRLRYVMLRELMETQPADQVQEYMLRTSAYARLPRNVPGIELSPEEMREIVRVFETANLEDRRDDEKATTEMAAIRELIGADRYSVFEPEVAPRIRVIRLDGG